MPELSNREQDALHRGRRHGARLPVASGGTLTTASFTATADGDVPTPVQIYTILVGSDWTAEATIRAMAEQNGGQFFDANNMDELTDAILKIFSSPLNQPPVIISDGGGATATILLDEGDFSVTTVQATDANVADPITYSIVGGADAGLSAIDALSGEVTLLAPGGAVPEDADGDGSYELVVGASDGLASDSQALTVMKEGGAGIELHGGNGKDDLTGTRGSDLLTGGNSQDVLHGLGGNDTLIGGNGSDVLDGGDGRDALSGGNGTDLLIGGGGADALLFGANGGADTIVDFEAALDSILLGGISVQSHRVADVDRDGTLDLTIAFSGGSSATLLGFSDFEAIRFESDVAAAAGLRAGAGPGMLVSVEALFA